MVVTRVRDASASCAGGHHPGPERREAFPPVPPASSSPPPFKQDRGEVTVAHGAYCPHPTSGPSPGLPTPSTPSRSSPPPSISGSVWAVPAFPSSIPASVSPEINNCTSLATLGLAGTGFFGLRPSTLGRLSKDTNMERVRQGHQSPIGKQRARGGGGSSSTPPQVYDCIIVEGERSGQGEEVASPSPATATSAPPSRRRIPVPCEQPDGDFSLLVGDWYKAGHKLRPQRDEAPARPSMHTTLSRSISTSTRMGRYKRRKECIRAEAS